MSRPDPLTRRDFFKALAASALAAGGAAVLPVGFPKGPELGMIATDSAAAPDIMIYFRYWFEPDGVPKFEQVSKVMPPKFERCRRQGGKIRTVKPKPDTYVKVCVRPKGKKGVRGGRTVSSYVRKTKKGKR